MKSFIQLDPADETNKKPVTENITSLEINAVTVTQVRVIAAHSSVIHGMSFDLTADHLGTCADDGSVVVCDSPT